MSLGKLSFMLTCQRLCVDKSTRDPSIPGDMSLGKLSFHVDLSTFNVSIPGDKSLGKTCNFFCSLHCRQFPADFFRKKSAKYQTCTKTCIDSPQLVPKHKYNITDQRNTNTSQLLPKPKDNKAKSSKIRISLQNVAS